MSRFQRIKIFAFCLLVVLIILHVLYDIHYLFLIAVVAAFVGIISAGAFIMSMQLFVPVKYKGSASANAIALTFDDGPIPGKTEKILEILAERKISAAFFCIGSRVTDNPDLLKRIDREGHLIGNHTFTHTPAFDFAPADKVASELTDTDSIIEKVLNKKPKYFRPPYGITNPMIAHAVKNGRYTVVGWSVRSFDTITKDPVKLFNRTARSLEAGDIILLHDYCDSTLAMLPRLLDHVEKKGLKIVRLDALLNEDPYR